MEQTMVIRIYFWIRVDHVRKLSVLLWFSFPDKEREEEEEADEEEKGNC